MSTYKLETIIKEVGVVYQSSGGMQLVDLARKGISKQSLLQLSNVAGLTLKELADLLPVSLRTIQRCNEDDLLDPSVSEHALLIAELIADAGNIFHSAEDVQSWLKSPLIGLGGIKPITLLDTSFGIRLVREELGRLEYGVFS